MSHNQYSSPAGNDQASSRHSIYAGCIQPWLHLLWGKVENGLEAWPQDVGLGLGVVVDVAQCQLLVQSQIPGCGGGLDAKPRYEVPAAYPPNEAHAQLHEREPVALWLG